MSAKAVDPAAAAGRLRPDGTRHTIIRSRSRNAMFAKISVQANPLRSQVADRIRKAMQAGALKPGERLRERELCESLGVSRTSIREALRMLESEGLVTMVPNRGAIVTEAGIKEATDVYHTRAALEGLMVRLFVQRASDAQIGRLEAIVEALDAGNAAFELDRFRRLKSEFFHVLVEGADNAAAARALSAIHTRVAQFWATSLSHPRRPRESVVEVRRMMEAIRARDEERAYAACQHHVQRALANVLQVLEVRERVADDAA
jgi:DNA-binding GntR family transcriptional regulator